MNDKTCKNCSHWQTRINYLNGYGICEEIDGVGKAGDDNILLDDVYEGQYLWTGKNFGCVKFIKKSN